MEPIVNIKLSEFPYPNLVKIEDLIYYEGPLLTHFQDNRENDYFFYWLDDNDEVNRWLVLLISRTHLHEYLTGSRNLRSIFFEYYNKTAVIADIDAEVNYKEVMFINMDNLPYIFYPTEKSFFKFGIPTVYNVMFEELSAVTNYVEAMRESAVFFKLNSLEDTFGKTLATDDVSNFLSKLTRSFLNYVDARFKILFSNNFSSERALGNALTRFLELVTPRVVDLKFESFGVDLASDILERENIPHEIAAWQKSLLEEYKSDVIDFDYSSTNNLSENLKGLTPEQLRAIFQPIIQLSRNPNFSVQVSDVRKGSIKKIKQIPQKTEKALFPKPNQGEEEPVQMEFTNMVLELEKDTELSSLTIAKLKKALLRLERNTETTLQLNSIENLDGNEIKLIPPIEFTLSVTNNFYETKYEPLNINRFSVSRQLAVDDFKRVVSRIYQMLENKSTEVMSEKEKRMFQHLTELIN